MYVISLHIIRLVLTSIAVVLFLSACSTPLPTEEAGSWRPSKKMLAKKDKLRELDLSEQDLDNIPAVVGEFNQLEKLYLQDNKLEKLPQQVGELDKVRRLNLANNNFTEFPEAVTGMESLKELDIRHNPINKLPETVSKMKKLNTLYVGGTNIDDETRAEIRKLLPKVKVIAGKN